MVFVPSILCLWIECIVYTQKYSLKKNNILFLFSFHFVLSAISGMSFRRPLKIFKYELFLKNTFSPHLSLSFKRNLTILHAQMNIICMNSNFRDFSLGELSKKFRIFSKSVHPDVHFYILPTILMIKLKSWVLKVIITKILNRQNRQRLCNQHTKVKSPTHGFVMCYHFLITTYYCLNIFKYDSNTLYKWTWNCSFVSV